jgi:hypothetical protein
MSSVKSFNHRHIDAVQHNYADAAIIGLMPSGFSSVVTIYISSRVCPHVPISEMRYQQVVSFINSSINLTKLEVSFVISLIYWVGNVLY